MSISCEKVVILNFYVFICCLIYLSVIISTTSTQPSRFEVIGYISSQTSRPTTWRDLTANIMYRDMDIEIRNDFHQVHVPATHHVQLAACMALSTIPIRATSISTDTTYPVESLIHYHHWYKPLWQTAHPKSHKYNLPWRNAHPQFPRYNSPWWTAHPWFSRYNLSWWIARPRSPKHKLPWRTCRSQFLRYNLTWWFASP